MRRCRQSAQRAVHLRDGAHSGRGVGATRRAARNAVAGIHLDVSRDRLRRGNGGPAGLAGFQCPFINGPADLFEVVDAGVLLLGGAGLDEVGDGNCGQQADDGHHDHDLHQGEARLG